MGTFITIFLCDIGQAFQIYNNSLFVDDLEVFLVIINEVNDYLKFGKRCQH